ncbi:MAG: sugar ABC transporter ATP-binding protein [Hyphomicrobiales bacterium]|nr:MAG: sugar ABC transporter ATP-binding protein [Hyphomicrobiales bacterium]
MPVLELSHITKRFGALVANDDISLSLEEGEVLALLGENGAGKTTLMNILFGHYVADEGEIRIAGERLVPGQPEAAIAAGIGMVHQHFTLADNLSVLENIILGTQSLWSLKSNMTQARAKLVQMSEEFGLIADPDAEVGTLSVGEKQRVEILKALYRDAKILILDEPTAVLTPQESDDLFVTLKSLTAKGLAIIFISHKLHEILANADRVAVLRRGAIVATVDVKDADRNSLAETMVGEKVVRPKLTAFSPGKPVLTLNQICVAGPSAEPLLKDIDMSVREHEILGIAGVAGNGQSVLADLLSGLVDAEAGWVELLGEKMQKFSAAQIIEKGVGRIPENRNTTGVIGEMAIWENVISESLRSENISKFNSIISKPNAIKQAELLIKQFDVRCDGPLAQTGLLSGGNIQKLILARALSAEPKFILANQPVRGLDEGAIAYVQTQLLAARERGAGILLISEDLDELLSFCDRVAVMCDGHLSPSFEIGSKTIAEIGLMMAGDFIQEQRSMANAN